ncbi:NAD-dependent epimerase/dehydratase family protein [Xylophilus sp.]|uniref:NAD-dependent epimerase/dehydratase family protein n=1 Tax=Xylophilus sp. TaxID=2653893 RepID=UPI0013BA3DDF|nr:NAD(P)-dependent oxidoreductase [Xylophilus sp.]KAF1049365.1 MAG: Uronate dehydrogenase [Xylophilus sp.]
MTTILITGAAGVVGTGLRRQFANDGLRLRLLDRIPVPDLAAHEETIVGDSGDPAVLREALKGVSAIVHLAGCTTDAAIEEQVEGNVLGVFRLFEAARDAGVARVVFASSHHTVGYYPRQRRIGTDVLLRPDSRYGLTKAFGEQTGAMFADKYGLRVLCIRIGFVADQPADRRRLSIWSSWRDLAQLVRIGLTHAQLRYAVVYGVSANTRGFFDNQAAFRLGYRPQDDAEQFAAEVLSTVPPEDTTLVGTHAMGGWGANNEYVGDVARIQEW